MGRRTPKNARPFAELAKIYGHSERHGCIDTAKAFKLSLDVVKNARRRFMKEMKLVDTRFTPQQYAILKNQARGYAGKQGLSQEADDFASVYTFEIARRPHANIQNVWIDYLRANLGDSNRTKIGAVKSSSILQSEEVGEVVSLGKPDAASYTQISDEYGFKGDVRVCFILHHEWGFTFEQLSALLGRPLVYVRECMDQIVQLGKASLS